MIRKLALGAIAVVPFAVPVLLAVLAVLLLLVIGYFVLMAALDRVRAKQANPTLIESDEAFGDESFCALPLTRGS